MGMWTLCTGKKAPIYGHGDTLHWQKGPHIWARGHFALAKGAHKWAWGHFELAKRPPYMGIGTLCTGKKAPLYGHGDTLHRQKGPNIWVAVGIKPAPIGGKNNLRSPFWPLLTPGVVLCQLGGAFTPRSFGGVGLYPHRGGCIPRG